MTELIIIKTHESEKIKKFLEQEQVDYEVYHEEEKPQKISEAALGRAYQEAWRNPQRYQEAQKWEKAAVSDWAERIKKEKK
ncbi:MAG: hypothetical protein MRERV_8c035 [Mycoplasmataceae bacterium RV_VA103A]|nr:MAG: hypothetical protein MRERV_8c035 [Mycoplasmataceae bacterium RV_VA103A]